MRATWRAVAMAVLLAGPAAAQQLPSDTVVAGDDVTRATELFNTIMSPFCPGLTLANCPSMYADTLRRSVRRRLEAGESEVSIMDSLVVAFGEGVRGAPRARGIGVLLWVLPFVALGFGAVGLGWWMRRRAPMPAPADRPAPAPPLSLEDREKLAAELKRFED